MWRAVVADARTLNILDLQIFCKFIVLMMGHIDFKVLTLNFYSFGLEHSFSHRAKLHLQPIWKRAERRCVSHCKGLYTVALIDREVDASDDRETLFEHRYVADPRASGPHPTMQQYQSLALTPLAPAHLPL